MHLKGGKLQEILCKAETTYVMIVPLKSSVNHTNRRNNNDYTKGDLTLLVSSLKTIFATTTDEKSLLDPFTG